MSLTLTKEDGTGLANANSYASVADCNAYHAAHLYASAWTSASTDEQAAALAMATMLIDVKMQFYGTRALDTQALQWPRAGCPDPDASVDGLTGGLVAANVVPPQVIAATCETARAMLIEDRTANPIGEGLKSSDLGGMMLTYDKKDRRGVLPRIAWIMLVKYGTSMARHSGAVRLSRA